MDKTEPKLLAFVMDDENTVYAHFSADEAAKLYAEDAGYTLDEIYEEYPRQLTDEVLDKPMPEYDEDEQPTGNTTSLRAYLNEMTGPGYLAGGRW